MKKAIYTALAVMGLFASTLSNAATVAIDFNSLTASTITSTATTELNSFTTLSSDGEIEIGNPLFSGSTLTILGFGSGDAIFTFDASVAVTSITLGGISNNAAVDITTFDLSGAEQDFFRTDSGWTSATTLSNPNPIGSFSVRLLESEISSLSITYENVAAVPVPAALWLFGSGLIGLAGIARRR